MTWWKARWLVVVLGLPAVLVGGARAQAQISVQIGVNFPSYPRLVRVPSHPVYYSPGAPANLFFYDGLYWLYVNDGWYTSSWYNGPWSWVDPFDVPVYVLRVPVRYYAAPPPYFRAWRADAPPHWGEHWGADWNRRHPGWNRWDPRHAPPPAPLPVYQRPYRGDRYPSPEEQRRLQERQYRYQPRGPLARAHFGPPAAGPVPTPHRGDRPVPAGQQDASPPHLTRQVPAPPPTEPRMVPRAEPSAPVPDQREGGRGGHDPGHGHGRAH